jgi:hypothetical protein
LPHARVAAVTGALVLFGGFGWAGPADAKVADPPECTSAYADNPVQQDLNGDDRPDAVEGVPTASVHLLRSAGVVDVHDFCALDGRGPQRISESFFTGLPPAAAGDRFGAAIAYTLLPSCCPDDYHYYATLVMGAPGANSGRGAVIVASGSPSGVPAADGIRIPGQTTGEQFGAAVVANGADVWVGAPDRTVSGHAGAGAIDHYRISGSSAKLVETLTEDTSGIPGLAEVNDHFGAVLAVDYNHVVVGEPDEDVGGAVDAGTVTDMQYDNGGARQRAVTISQNSPGISGGAEAGDRFGAAVSVDAADYLPASKVPGATAEDALIAVGVPGEDLGSLRDAGTAHLVRITPAGAVTQLASLTQESPTIPGGSEAGDQFGASVLLGDVDGQVVQSGHDRSGFEDLAIGAPGEDLATVVDAGDVIVVQLASTFHAVGPVLRQGGGGTADLGGSAVAGNRVGTTLSPLASPSPGDQTGGASLLVGLPGQDAPGATDSGAVAVGYGAGSTFLDSAGPLTTERYGSVAPTTISNGPILEVQD